MKRAGVSVPVSGYTACSLAPLPCSNIGAYDSCVSWDGSHLNGQLDPNTRKVQKNATDLLGLNTRVQELCESRGGRPGLSVLMSLTVSVDVKQH